MENNNPKSAIERKAETEKFLKAHNIPYIQHLPVIEEETEVKIRKPNEIAERILILTYLSYLAEVPESRNDVVSFLKNNNLWSKTTNEEKKLFEKKSLTQQEQINISWKAEAIWTLLWSIKKVDKLGLPDEQVDIEKLISKMPKLLTNPNDFIESAEIRTTTEILDMSDLIYRIHWATRDAYLNNKPTPANLDEGIVMERHHAINWITYYADNWDDVTTDT